MHAYDDRGPFAEAGLLAGDTHGAPVPHGCIRLGPHSNAITNLTGPTARAINGILWNTYTAHVYMYTLQLPSALCTDMTLCCELY